MTSKLLKITVDILMLLAIVFSYRRWDGNPTSHIIAGVVCVLLFAIHFCLNRKMFIAFNKAAKKLNRTTRQKYLIDLLLLVVWSITIITGFIALGAYVGVFESMFNFGRIHGVFARIGGVLIVVHILQHGKQIVSYIKRNKARR